MNAYCIHYIEHNYNYIVSYILYNCTNEYNLYQRIPIEIIQILKIKLIHNTNIVDLEYKYT